MLTIAFVTSRLQPKFGWFFDSLRRQTRDTIINQIILVDYFAQDCDGWTEADVEKRRSEVAKAAAEFSGVVEWVAPKPNVWGGKFRLPKESWWHVSAGRNTALCLARESFLVWTDDRCVLGPHWLEGVRQAARCEYAVCGTYIKNHGMVVENGVILDAGKLDGKDHRTATTVIPCHNQFWGGTLGCPTEWALAINGFNELLDGLGHEDVHFGMTLANAGYCAMFDPSISVIQDRTPGQTGPVMKKTSKERHPNDTQDKGHAALRRFAKSKRSEHHWNLREIRDAVLRGEPFKHHGWQPDRDWFDNSLIKDF